METVLFTRDVSSHERVRGGANARYAIIRGEKRAIERGRLLKGGEFCPLGLSALRLDRFSVSEYL